MKVETRNLVGETLEFEVWEDKKQDNHTDGYSTYDTWDDEKLPETVQIKIDDEGNGEASFTVPCDWENKHSKGKEGQPRYFYLKEKESGEEFPRAYYVKNPNKTEEENKKNSNRIGALMLKVAKSIERDRAQEKSSAVVLGEELPPPVTKEKSSKNGWSIEVHLYNDREKMGYGILVLLDGNNEEYWRTIVRAQGFRRKIGENRTEKMGDTPTGTYKFEQWRSDGSSTIYGPNPRLDMTYESGEAKAVGREEIQIHGGRQENTDNPYLWNTGGCLRVYDDAIKILKEKIERLNTPEIEKYFIYIKNDLIYDSDSEKYFIPSDFQELGEKGRLKSLLDKGVSHKKQYRNENSYYTGMLDN